jgi:hypothetical protein
MTITYDKFFAPVVLGTAAVTLFTVPALPASTLLRAGRMRFTNTTASPITATGYVVPPLGTAADSNAFVKAKSVPANDFLDVDVPIMPAGAFLQALAGAATGVTVHMLSGSYFS